ncbi:hypothetical protein [Sphingomonas sp.]|uniref:hypothetical protein n=1 Tax=Sphingomonas sp. TaxID=28214 RepID=UPI003CC69144
MTAPIVTDHALVRFLTRVGFDVEPLREALAASLERAHTAALALGADDHLIVADGLCYLIRTGSVVTVVEDGDPVARAKLLSRRSLP